MPSDHHLLESCHYFTNLHYYLIYEDEAKFRSFFWGHKLRISHCNNSFIEFKRTIYQIHHTKIQVNTWSSHSGEYIWEYSGSYKIEQDGNLPVHTPRLQPNVLFKFGKWGGGRNPTSNPRLKALHEWEVSIRWAEESTLKSKVKFLHEKFQLNLGRPGHKSETMSALLVKTTWTINNIFVEHWRQ